MEGPSVCTSEFSALTAGFQKTFEREEREERYASTSCGVIELAEYQKSSRDRLHF